MRMEDTTVSMGRVLLGTWAVLVLSMIMPAFSVGADAASADASKALLLIGTATGDITPADPVALRGQFNLRVARTVESPLTVNVLALESRRAGEPSDAAVLVSCDLIAIPDDVRELVREQLRARLPDLDANKIVLSATHTHTAPVMGPGEYDVPADIMQPEAYRAFLVERVADTIQRAWSRRAPGSVTWGLGHAVVAYNRRAVYADGSAVMYGRTDVPEFRGIEGYEDHDVDALFCWNTDGKLIAIGVSVPCPSQMVESRSAVNADFWHPVRQALYERYGTDVCVLGWTGAAGDQSPRPMYRKAAEARMARLRGLEPMDELARRIVRAVDEAYEVVREDRHADAPLVHHVRTLHLPARRVTEAEYAEAQAAVRQATEAIARDPKAADQHHRRMGWHQRAIQRYEAQQENPDPLYEMELHVVRIGDAVICTNPFELFTDYGIQIKARSRAVQTFVVQLTGSGSYLPSERAVRGGGYSAVVQSSKVGPQGGQVLVDQTVEAIDAMFGTPAKP